MIRLIASRYQLHELLSTDSLGNTYRATDRLSGQFVALKRILGAPEHLYFSTRPAGNLSATAARQALVNEFKYLTSLRHTHVLSVLDYGFDEERRPFYTTPLLENAMTIVEATRTQPITYRVRLLVHMLQGLAYLHRRGILQYHLKPANVLVHHGHVYLQNFGLSISGAQISLGVASYTAPEILQGAPAAVVTDLYGVGVILYEVLSGHLPFSAESVPALLERIMGAAPNVRPLLDTLETHPLEDDAKLDTTERTSLNFDITDQIPLHELFMDDRPTVEIGISDLQRQLAMLDSGVVPDHPTMELPPAQDGNSRGDDTAIGMMYESTLIGNPLVSIVLRLLSKKPEYRYQDTASLIRMMCMCIKYPLPPDSQLPPLLYLQPIPFINRAAEVELLTDAVDTMMTTEYPSEPSPHVYIVVGESGVGKTRLLEEVGAYALTRGALVLRGYGINGGFAYHLWTEPLRRLALSADLKELDISILAEVVPDIERLLRWNTLPAPEVKGALRRKRLAARVATLLHQYQRPLVLLLEDLQWSEESVELLGDLLPVIMDLPVLVIGSYRGVNFSLLPQVETIPLSPFNHEQIAALTYRVLPDSSPALLQTLEKETGGNLYLLTSWLHTLREEPELPAAPENMVGGGNAQLLVRRLKQVAEWAQPILNLAAVAGREVDTSVLYRAVWATSGVHENTLEEWISLCVNAGFLEHFDGGWRFLHARLHETLLNSLTFDRRALLHRQIAEALENVYRRDRTRTIMLVEHWRYAGNVDKERFYAVSAGEQTLYSGQALRAKFFFDRAETLLPETGDTSERMAIVLLLAEACASLKQNAEAIRHFHEALVMARRRQDKAGVSAALFGLGEVALAQRDYEAAHTYFKESLTMSAEFDRQIHVAASLLRLGETAMLAGDLSAAQSFLEDALAVLRRLDDRASLAECLQRLSHVYEAGGNITKAQNTAEESHHLYEAIGIS